MKITYKNNSFRIAKIKPFDNEYFRESNLYIVSLYEDRNPFWTSGLNINPRYLGLFSAYFTYRGLFVFCLDKDEDGVFKIKYQRKLYKQKILGNITLCYIKLKNRKYHFNIDHKLNVQSMGIENANKTL